MFRQQLARQVRLFSTTRIARKSPVEMAKDAVKAVDRTVSDAAVKSIETGEAAASAVKDALPDTKGEAKGQAHEAAGQVKGKANEMAGEAKGKASELKGEINKKL